MKKTLIITSVIITLLLAVSCATTESTTSPAPISNANPQTEIQVLSSKPVHFLTAGPGQDASTQTVISWHALTPSCTLVYAPSSEPGQTKSVVLEGEPTKSDWYDLDSIYRFKITLSELTPGTTYTYQVKTEDGQLSDAGEFKTAGTDGTFSFAWLSDIHINLADNMKNVSELLSYIKEKTDIDFCLFSGDMVNRGQTYRYWDYWTESGVLSEMEYAFVVGNHEYYTSKNKKVSESTYFMDFAAIPENHVEGSSDADYWFLYDNVLFLCLDSIAADIAQGNSVRDRQLDLIKTAIDQEWGHFRYIIVVQHYAFLDGDADGAGKYSYFYQVFDNAGIDLALSSDTHAYSRSKTLFNDHEDSFGTVYVTSPMTEGKEFSEFVSITDSLGERSAYNTVSDVSGGCYIEVTPTELTLHVLGRDGVEYDSVTIPAHR